MMRLFEKQEIYMNSTIIIKVVSDLGTVKSYELLDKAFEQFQIVVKNFSRFDPNSELSRLNSNQEKNFKVSDELFFLVEQSLEVAKLSGGLYDPTVIDLLETYGYDAKKDFSKLDNPALLNKELNEVLKKRAFWRDIELNKEKKTVKLRPKQRIDLGAIGKGYAIELAAGVLKEAKNFLINAGGDTYGAGINEEGKKWRVGMSLPGTKDEIFGLVEVDGYSLSCSGSWANNFKQFNHLLNPNTGKGGDVADLAFVYHKSATLSDAYATLLSLMGEAGLEVLEKQKTGAAIVISDKLIVNKYFPKILTA